MAYRLRLEVHGVEAAIRALDLLRRLEVPMLGMETARTQDGFLVHVSYEAAAEDAARHIAVRIGQIVGVATAELLPDADAESSAALHPLPIFC
ncbi:hypothetical protein ABLE93_18060 [Xanthobacter sp. KR7-65]|uniref:hypothetical protein n=1 Tax=Xanthobacter sp. KR7-65 TaxID=3156612 RepID=UPI0032B37F71